MKASEIWPEEDDTHDTDSEVSKIPAYINNYLDCNQTADTIVNINFTPLIEKNIEQHTSCCFILSQSLPFATPLDLPAVETVEIPLHVSKSTMHSISARGPYLNWNWKAIFFTTTHITNYIVAISHPLSHFSSQPEPA